MRVEKFNRTLRGYDPVEVNRFLDQVISQVEGLIKELKVKNTRIAELEAIEQENKRLRQKIEQYEKTEETLNRAIIMAQKTSDQMRMSARQESEALINEARQNANRIVNDALLKAERAQDEADMLKRNVTIFKRRLRDIVEAQLEVVEDIEKIDF